jgi:hypothetical protein
VAPATLYASGWPQPPYTQTHWPEIWRQQAQLEHTNYVNRSTSLVRAAAQEKPTMISGTSGGKYFLTQNFKGPTAHRHKQSHLTARRKTKMGLRRRRLVGWILMRNPPPIIQLVHHLVRICRPSTSTVLVQPELDWFKQTISNRTKRRMPRQMSTETRRRDHRDWYSHLSHTMDRQGPRPPGGYPRHRLTPKTLT